MRTAMSGGLEGMPRRNRDDEQLQRRSSILAIGETRFLQIEIAFDAPPYLVGDLAVAQQDMDELPLRRDQFPGQVGPRRRDVMLVGIERVRQLVGAGLVPRAQQP